MATATEIKNKLPRFCGDNTVLVDEYGKAIYVIAFISDRYGKPEYTLTHYLSDDDYFICYFDEIEDRFNVDRQLYLTYRGSSTGTVTGIEKLSVKMIG